MNNLFPINAPLTVVWHLSKPDGSDFNLYGYDYRLFYKSGKGKTEVASTAVTSDGNVVSFVFPSTAQRFPGGYSLQLVLYQNGRIFCDLNYNNAFFFSRFDSAPQPSEHQEADARIVHLYTVAEYYLLSPVIPVVGPDGYWYANGSIVLDGDGNPVPSTHSMEYDSETGYIIIDRGKVDGHGQSIQQTITVIADAMASEAVREGNEARRLATEGRMNTLLNNIVVNFLADTDVYEQAVEQGFVGTREEWLASTLGVKGLGIKTWVINQSTADSGTTTHTITLNDGDAPNGPTVYTFTVKNGKGIANIEQTTVSSQDGGTNVATITYSDGTTKTLQFKNGSGIASITSNTSHVDGGENTITITTSDGRTKTVTFYNGHQGNTGSSVGYAFELLNTLDSTATDKGVTAAKIKELNESALHLGDVVETLS